MEQTSKWNNPVMMIDEGKKEDGTTKWRLVVDQKTQQQAV
jgi:hypothetical protein